ncbi:type VII secretion target [Kitasatospora sp. NBC_01287]|uniref:type VII secretion target n=1 Tax=Kitasatospora sp. NBC_01287 TaxID=2903573 RepID=UPI00224F66F3|nr:type VII secretion target [Kitasatospora sp. NBC_01287]MCX4751332.1 type VII secretion target [Kitasatospora sp. NBC_01287]
MRGSAVGGGGFTVDPDALDAAAGAGHTVAGAIRAEAPQSPLPLTSVDGSSIPKMGGWKLIAPAQSCSDAWTAHLTALAGSLDAVSQKLSTTAAQYRRSDDQNHLVLDSAGSTGGAN